MKTTVKTPHLIENSRIYSAKRGQAQKEQKNLKIEGSLTPLSIQAVNPKMSELTVPNPSPLQEKISKLKSLLSEENFPGHNKSDNQWRREAKLQQKLRYLQFYEDYSVGTTSTAGWHCSHCKPVLVDKNVVTYPGCGMQGKCTHRVSHKKEIIRKVSQIVCEDTEEHQREWEQWQKSQVEARNIIKREFSAMIAKEKHMKTDKRRSNKENKLSRNDDLKVLIKAPQSYRNTKQDKQDHPIENAAIGSEGKPNFHSDQCKTCSKMESLMGSILPHPINIRENFNGVIDPE